MEYLNKSKIRLQITRGLFYELFFWQDTKKLKLRGRKIVVFEIKNELQEKNIRPRYHHE